jgi:hypothetical protein
MNTESITLNIKGKEFINLAPYPLIIPLSEWLELPE